MDINREGREGDSSPTAEPPDGDNDGDGEHFGANTYDESDWLELHQLKNYLHESDLNEISAPSTASWVDGDQCRMRTKFGINLSRKQNWDFGKEEAEHVKARVNIILDVEDQKDVTFEMLVDKFLGPASEMGKVLKTELQLNDEVYLAFLATYCIQSAYRVSSTSLFGKFSLLSNASMMPEKEYNTLWRRIAHESEKSGLQIGTGRRDLCRWQKLESTVNQDLRSVSVVDRPGKISIALDDDKVWYNMAKKAIRDTFGLKITRHVKDNRIGMILHTAVSSALNIPLGCTFERVKENTQTCYERIFQDMFGSHGGCDLLNVNAHSDRGYSLPSVVFDFLIANGANVVCTTKRYLVCWPYNFGHTHSANDPRTFIDAIGAPSLFIKNTTVGGIKRVSAVAFRNGSGAVSTAVSSMHSGFEWEGVTEIDGCKLLRMYDQDESSLRSLFFERVEGLCGDEEEQDVEDDDDADLCAEILDSVIDPLTMHQGTADWHYLRKFSLTSSQTFESFKLAFPLFRDDASWNYMGRYAFGTRFGAVLGLLDDESSEDEDEPAAVPSVSDYLADVQIDDDEDQSCLNLLQRCVRDDETMAEDRAKALVAGMTSSYKNNLKAMLLDRIPRAKQGQCSDALLVRWFTYSNAARNFVCFSSTALKALLKERQLRAAGGTSIAHLIQTLAGTRPGNPTAPTLEAKEAAIKALLTHSFQKPQKGAAREYCSLGHKLELPILSSWIKVTKDRYYPVRGLCVTSAYKAGLAGKRGEPAVKDSIDFHLHVEETTGGDRKAWGFEAKGRVTVGTALAEVDTLTDLVRDDHVRIPDRQVHSHLAVPKERWQVLHHAYVYDYKTVVHAVGDSQGELIQSTLIDFGDVTKNHYYKVLKDLTELTIEWAYSSDRSPVHIPDDVTEVAKHVATINGDATLQGTVNLWKEISILKLPLPPLHRIIPSVHANWNQKKSGSDTTTMLMDGCLAPLPHTNPESVAVNRLISMMFVLVHRLGHLYTADEQLDYPSLGHYRNAASHRSTFRATFLACRQVFVNALDEIRSPADQQSSHTPQASRSRPLREKVSNVVIERIDNDHFNVPAPMPMKTPAKLAKSIMQGTAPEAFTNLDRHCKGIPFKVYSDAKKPLQMRCDSPSCEGKTSWFCAGCKQWFCMEKKVKDDMSEVANFGVGKITIKGKDKLFQLNCYHRKHVQVSEDDE